jgi:hypothetical protein
MKRLLAWATAAIAATVFGCANMGGGDWVTMIDGEKGLENFDRIGEANWRAEGGAIVADKGKGGQLVSKKSYKDFVIYAEFYAESDTNSGIFLRASNPKEIGAVSAYEVNIWDIRPDPKYGTGAIVDVASVPVPLKNKAGGRWNTYEIYARGPQLIVKLNGEVTSSATNSKHAAGPFSLQYGAGVKGAMGGPIKWRKVMIKEL